VTYSNLILAAAISSPVHPVWQWLAKRNGRVAGLSVELRATQNGEQLSGWMQALQTLSGIPSVQLRLEWIGRIAGVDHPCIAQWLKQHAQLISHLTAEVDIGEGSLTLKEFSEAAAACRSINLRTRHVCDEVVDLSDIDAVAGSLQSLKCEPTGWSFADGNLRGTSALNCMSQLSALHFGREDLENEEPWNLLAKLTSLQRLKLEVVASGDPSPLSALTGLTYLHLQNLLNMNGPDPFEFSSVQPLSTLRQLEVLHLGTIACAATSLQGFAGLSNLKLLELVLAARLKSIEGISPGVIELSVKCSTFLKNLAGIEGCTILEKLSLHYCSVCDLQPLGGLSSMKDLKVSKCPLTSLEGLNSRSLRSLTLTCCSSLTHLSGVEHLSALKSLEVRHCGVTSLQPLSQLREGLQKLNVITCKQVQEEVLELPNVQPTAYVFVYCSNAREVLLAGGVWKAVQPA
jgi:hypothetical protein